MYYDDIDILLEQIINTDYDYQEEILEMILIETIE